MAPDQAYDTAVKTGQWLAYEPVKETASAEIGDGLYPPTSTHDQFVDLFA